MPALSDTVIEDITNRLIKYLKKHSDYGDPSYIASGGSAAVFKVPMGTEFRGFKVFSPHFFQGLDADATRKRLKIQAQLIGQECTSLINTYKVEEAEGTAFIEMEYVSWPQLNVLLPTVPDESVTILILQLVKAVQFLEKLGIAHRDIKPENIHVSDDYKNLKLLDLGVVKEIAEENSADDGSITDQDNARPFLATAQYSSPEYLFRLDEPSQKLWKGLNFYQIGAVLHDLIMKKPLFQQEIDMKNRWLVARAVLTKTPSFADGDPNRLAALKALASRCLIKDLDARLHQVSWGDFILDGAYDPMARLKSRMLKGLPNTGTNSKLTEDTKLEFDRNNFQVELMNQVRIDLINVCGTALPITMTPSKPSQSFYCFKFSLQKSDLTIDIRISFSWLEEIYNRTANVLIKAKLALSTHDNEVADLIENVISTVSIDDSKHEALSNITSKFANVIEHALNIIESSKDVTQLHGLDLLK